MISNDFLIYILHSIQIVFISTILFDCIFSYFDIISISTILILSMNNFNMKLLIP